MLEELQEAEGTTLERKLDADAAAGMEIEKIDTDEKAFRWQMNEDAMATEKLAEGIRNFAADQVKLEQLVSA